MAEVKGEEQYVCKVSVDERLLEYTSEFKCSESVLDESGTDGVEVSGKGEVGLKLRVRSDCLRK